MAERVREYRTNTVIRTVTPGTRAQREWRAGHRRAALAGTGADLASRHSEPLNLTAFALRLSDTANGVSIRHGEVARAMWATLWPDRRTEDVPIDAVTNGAHVATWMAPGLQRLLNTHTGPDWMQRGRSRAIGTETATRRRVRHPAGLGTPGQSCHAHAHPALLG